MCFVLGFLMVLASFCIYVKIGYLLQQDASFNLFSYCRVIYKLEGVEWFQYFTALILIVLLSFFGFFLIWLEFFIV